MKNKILLGLATFSLLIICAMLASSIAYAVAGPNHVPGRYIVVLNDDVPGPPAVANEMAARHGLKPGHVYQHAIKGYSCAIPDHVLDRVMNDPRVKYIEQDAIYYYAGQTLPTGVNRIDADLNATADIDEVDERVDADIAIIDSGIDTDHPDLNVVGGKRFYSIVAGPKGRRGSYEDDKYDDYNGHGSHVAGTAAALDNSFGVVGVAPGARLWAVKVESPNGALYLSDIIKGVDWVTDNAGDIEVANMSLGGSGYSSALRAAIQSSVAEGVVYVVSAGNSAQEVYGADLFNTYDDYCPAAFPEVATISAMADTDGEPGGTGGLSYYGEADDSMASFSNYSGLVVSGNPVTSPGAAIDLMLPGVDILSTYKDGGYATGSGTSMASPHAAGLAALYIAVNGRAIDANGVYAIRQALIDEGVAQGSDQGLAVLNDPDGNKEKIGWAGAPADAPPTVAITSPLDGATVSGMIITIEADATDDVAVTQVEFFIDGDLLSTVVMVIVGVPYSYSWDTTTAADGPHAIRATATDTIGQTASYTITVEVDNVDDSPTVAITSPVNGDTVSGMIDIVASAIDDKGVNKVEFFIDGSETPFAIDSISPYSCTWDTADYDEDSVHSITATAYDTHDPAQTSSHTITVTADNTAPSQVTGLSVEVISSSQLDLSWAANSAESDLAYYKVYRRANLVDPYAEIASSAVNSYPDTGLDAATTYYYVVSAVDSAGNEGATSTKALGTTSEAVTNEMHVSNIEMSLNERRAGRNYFTRAFAIITIVDTSNNLVDGATVNGSWSDATSDIDSRITNTAGQVTVESDEVKNAPVGTTFTFNVDVTENGVVKSDWTYKSSVNVETSDSVTVP